MINRIEIDVNPVHAGDIYWADSIVGTPFYHYKIILSAAGAASDALERHIAGH